jgi:nicotinate-nucleotide--dimethylbenzimidazole phosphoribosyltransferase
LILTHEAIIRQFENLPGPDVEAGAAVEAHEKNLTKPAGALGKLEELCVWCATWQARYPPSLDNTTILIFAGNHGVAKHGVSAFPSAVTAQMVRNFKTGGAAINQLAAVQDAKIEVVELDLEEPTADFTIEPAMSEPDFLKAFTQGFDSVEPSWNLLIVGEMGIGNTTSAAALSSALFGGDPADWTGPGTGLNSRDIARKASIIRAGLERHATSIVDPLSALQCLGGRELAAVAGAILAARRRRIPVFLDGFVTTAAAAVLEKVSPGALDHCVLGHVSFEPGHKKLLTALNKTPLLDLGMRLGEASGAAVALGILRCAIAAHTGMATFEEAAISRKV